MDGYFFIGVLFFIFWLFWGTVLIQFFADKYKWVRSPHSFLMEIADSLENMFRWMGARVAEAISILITWKDKLFYYFHYLLANIHVYLMDLVVAAGKIIEPLWLCIISFIHFFKGYFDFAVAYLQSTNTETENGMWFILPAVLIVGISVVVGGWYLDNSNLLNSE